MYSGKLVLNWDGFQGNLNSELNLLREDFLDVTIVCDDEQISAHKVILSASSEFFRGILRRNPRESPIIYLKGTKMAHLKLILNFIYTGQIEVAEEDLAEILEAAVDLKIKGLSNSHQKIEESKPNVKASGYEEKVEDRNTTFETIEEELEELFEESRSKPVSPPNDKIQTIQPNKTSILKGRNPELDQQIESLMVSSFDPVTGRTIWRCVQCGYSPKMKYTLKEHVETHIAGINYSCSVCDKICNTSNSLRVHKIRTHSNKFQVQ